MGTANALNTGLRHAEVLHLALRDEILHSARDFFDGDTRIDAMLIEQIDHICAQALQCRLRYFADALRPAVHAHGGLAFNKAELGGDDDLVPKGSERLAQEFFVQVGAIGLRGVEESNPALICGPDQLEGLLLLCCRTVAVAETHATQSQS